MAKNIVKLNESTLRRLVAESVVRTINEIKVKIDGPEMSEEELVQKAKELYQDVEWDDYEIDDVDGGYATGSVFGSVEDENGGVWEFTGWAGFNWEGDWVLDDVSEVEFTAPNGQEGYI